MPGLPIVTAKALDNMISSYRVLASLNINSADILDLSFLQRMEEESKKSRQ
jgi:hypothetical protein